jgi:DNA mismatch endonuclease (patch repair protein)
MQANRSRDTKPEQALRSALHRRGLRFRKHVRPLSGLRCTADIVFPSEKVAVFVDGCFWHRCPVHSARPQTNESYWSAKIDRNAQRDRRNSRLLREAGWEVIRVWEHESPQVAAGKIESRVMARRGA